MAWVHLREEFLTLCRVEYHSLRLYELRLDDPTHLRGQVKYLHEQLSEWIEIGNCVKSGLVTLEELCNIIKARDALQMIFATRSINWGAVRDAASFLRDAAGKEVAS